MLAVAVGVHNAPGAGLNVDGEIDLEGALGEMPGHTRVDDQELVHLGERLESVVDLMVDLGVSFHVLVKLDHGHTVLLCYRANDRAGGVILCAETVDNDLCHGALTAAEVACK